MEFRKADVANKGENQAKKYTKEDILHEKRIFGTETSDRSKKQKLLAKVQQDLRALAASADVSQHPREHPLHIEELDDLFLAKHIEQVSSLFAEKSELIKQIDHLGRIKSERQKLDTKLENIPNRGLIYTKKKATSKICL